MSDQAVAPARRETRMIVIPRGSRPVPCMYCGQYIYFSHPSHKTGKKQPISIEHPAAVEPTSTTNGFGISHFADCPSAAEARKPR